MIGTFDMAYYSDFTYTRTVTARQLTEISHEEIAAVELFDDEVDQFNWYRFEGADKLDGVFIVRFLGEHGFDEGALFGGNARLKIAMVD